VTTGRWMVDNDSEEEVGIEVGIDNEEDSAEESCGDDVGDEFVVELELMEARDIVVGTEEIDGI
jgi:hypothetical protein